MINFSKPLGIKCCSAGVVLVVCAAAFIWIKQRNSRKNLEKKAAAKRQKEQDFIKSQLDALALDNIDSRTAERILGLSTNELLEELRKTTLKPTNVLKIYLQKASKVTQSLNCVTEVIRENFQFAENLETRNPNDLPLYGLPVSLKESYYVKGCVTTIGLITRLNNIAKDDGNIVKVLKHLGAVPFVRTNLPQMMMSYGSDNPIYGTTLNPHNLDFGPGGSSSGEGSLIGAGGSLLGIGSDIGGSIRTPAHLCGICGLKPTQMRLGVIGQEGPLPGFNALRASAGPMARDVDTIVTVMRALLCEYLFKLEPSVNPIPFRDELYSSKKRLRIGYYYDDGYQKPIPACQRAVRMAKEALEKAGHTLVPYKIPDIELVMELVNKAIFAENGHALTKFIEKDIPARCVKYLLDSWNMPIVCRKFLSLITGWKYPRIAKCFLTYSPNLSVETFWENSSQLQIYAAKFLQEWREKYEIDAVICPAFPVVACPKDAVYILNRLWSYSTPHTVVDCPAGVVPVTKVTLQDIKELDDYQGHYNDPWDENVKQACKGSINMPVAVQCVGYPWQEEVVLRVMKEVESLLKY